MLAFYSRNGRLYMARLSKAGQEAVSQGDGFPYSTFWTPLAKINVFAAIINLINLLKQ